MPQSLAVASFDPRAKTCRPKTVFRNKIAVSTAKPFLEQAINFLATSEPAALGQYALALVAAYYLLPSALKAGAGVLRGYAGDVSAVAALTAVSEGSVSETLGPGPGPGLGHSCWLAGPLVPCRPLSCLPLSCHWTPVHLLAGSSFVSQRQAS